MNPPSTYKHWNNMYLSTTYFLLSSYRCLLQIQSVGGRELQCALLRQVVSVVCVWAGVGEALRWNWRHNDSLSPDPQTLARSSHSRGLFYLIGLIKLMLFQVVNTDYEILDICWIRFLVAAAWSTENWEMTVLLSVCLCFNVSLCHGTAALPEETGRGHFLFI